MKKIQEKVYVATIKTDNANVRYNVSLSFLLFLGLKTQPFNWASIYLQFLTVVFNFKKKTMPPVIFVKTLGNLQSSYAPL